MNTSEYPKIETALATAPSDISEFESQFDQFEDSVATIANRIMAVREQIDEFTKGQPGDSSFYDVTGNLLAVALSTLRACKDCTSEDFDDPDEKEDSLLALDDLKMSIDHLELYVKLLQQHPELLEAEMQGKAGAYPELRSQSNQEAMENRAVPAIPRYVEHLAAELTNDTGTQKKIAAVALR